MKYESENDETFFEQLFLSYYSNLDPQNVYENWNNKAIKLTYKKGMKTFGTLKIQFSFLARLKASPFLLLSDSDGGLFRLDSVIFFVDDFYTVYGPTFLFAMYLLSLVKQFHPH